MLQTSSSWRSMFGIPSLTRNSRFVVGHTNTPLIKWNSNSIECRAFQYSWFVSKKEAISADVNSFLSSIAIKTVSPIAKSLNAEAKVWKLIFLIKFFTNSEVARLIQIKVWKCHLPSLKSIGMTSVVSDCILRGYPWPSSNPRILHFNKLCVINLISIVGLNFLIGGYRHFRNCESRLILFEVIVNLCLRANTPKPKNENWACNDFNLFGHSNHYWGSNIVPDLEEKCFWLFYLPPFQMEPGEKRIWALCVNIHRMLDCILCCCNCISDVWRFYWKQLSYLMCFTFFTFSSSTYRLAFTNGEKSPTVGTIFI